IFFRHAEHFPGPIDGHHLSRGSLVTKLDGYLCRAGADVEDGITAVPNGKEISDKEAIDRCVIHGVVVASLLASIHDLRLKDTRQHGGTGQEDGPPAVETLFHCRQAVWLS